MAPAVEAGKSFSARSPLRRDVAAGSAEKVNVSTTKPLSEAEGRQAGLFFRLAGKAKRAFRKVLDWWLKQTSSDVAATKAASEKKTGQPGAGPVSGSGERRDPFVDPARPYEMPRTFPATRDVNSPLPDVPVEPSSGDPVDVRNQTGLLVLVRSFRNVEDSIRDNVFINVRDGKITDMEGVMDNLREETIAALEPRVQEWYEDVAGALPTEDVYQEVVKLVMDTEVTDTRDVVREVEAAVQRLADAARERLSLEKTAAVPVDVAKIGKMFRYKPYKKTGLTEQALADFPRLNYVIGGKTMDNDTERSIQALQDVVTDKNGKVDKKMALAVSQVAHQGLFFDGEGEVMMELMNEHGVIPTGAGDDFQRINIERLDNGDVRVDIERRKNVRIAAGSDSRTQINLKEGSFYEYSMAVTVDARSVARGRPVLIEAAPLRYAYNISEE